MTEEEKKPEEEVDEEELENVEGGFLERFPNVPLEEASPLKKDVPPTVQGSGGEDR